MHILKPPQRKYYYDFWEVLRYFGVDRHTPEAQQFINWLTDNGNCPLRNAALLTFDEKDTDPFIFGLQEEVPALVKSVMLKAMAVFGESQEDGMNFHSDPNAPRILNLMFNY